MRKIILALSLTLLFSIKSSAYDCPPPKEPPHTVSVSGKASLEAPPDKATVQFSIVTRDKKAEKARVANELTSKAILNSARELGVSDRFMQLQSLSVGEDQIYNPKTQTYEFEEYKAVRSFIVELHDLDKLAGVIAAVVSHGSNDLNSVQYGLIDPDALRLQALTKASAQAAEKADLMLSSLGEKRGATISIDEQYNNYGYRENGFQQADMVMLMAKAAPAPVAEPDAFATGRIEVEASVRAVFTIDNAKAAE